MTPPSWVIVPGPQIAEIKCVLGLGGQTVRDPLQTLELSAKKSRQHDGTSLGLLCESLFPFPEQASVCRVYRPLSPVLSVELQRLAFDMSFKGISPRRPA